MSAEEELKAFKLQTLKRSRVTSIVLGSAAVIAVLFVVYGFTQNIEVNRQRDLRLDLEHQLWDCLGQAAIEQSLMIERRNVLLEKIDSLTNANNKKTKK